MQFRLQLCATHMPAHVPFNYQYLLTGWLYRLLSEADGAYAHFLHQQGYRVAGPKASRKTFRLFTFSDLRMHGYEVRPRQGCFILTSPLVDWTLSFYIDRAAEAFIKGLFQDQLLTLINRRFRTELTVERVETLPLPTLTDVLKLRTLSPVVVAAKDETGMAQYIHPADEDFGPLLLNNLLDKYRSVYGHDTPLTPHDLSFRLLTDPAHIRSRLIAIKEGSFQETRIRGFYRFDFAIDGPADALELGLLAGVGRHNAEGFGCVEPINQY